MSQDTHHANGSKTSAAADNLVDRGVQAANDVMTDEAQNPVQSSAVEEKKRAEKAGREGGSR